MPESYTGDEGDDALAEGFDVMDGNEDRRDGWRAINKARDYAAQVKASLESLTIAWASITGKPTTFPPSSHEHSALRYAGGKLFGFAPSANEWNTAQNMYVGGYLNVIGTIFNPSARRFKRNITAAPPLSDIFPTLVEYERIGGNGERELGYLADELVGTDAERFVKFDQDGQPEAIGYLALLIAQNAQLHARVAALEARDE